MPESPFPIQFVGGLPRSGTTLLANLLGQNSNHHVTATSGLIHLSLAILDKWPNVEEFKTQGLASVKPRVSNSIRGLMLGFYSDEIAAGKIVFDKSRGWTDLWQPLEKIVGQPLKMIVSVRDVRDIAASFEKIYRNRGIEWRYSRGEKYPLSHTSTERTRYLFSRDQVVGRAIARLRDVIDSCGDRLIVVPYQHLCSKPQDAMATVHEGLELPAFKYKPSNVEQVTCEDDNHIGMDLHRIRTKITPAEKEPWNGLLCEDLCAELADEYADINKLASDITKIGVTR